MESLDFDLLKNFGISSMVINYGLKEKRNEVYVIKQDKIKKNFSDGAIQKIPSSISFLSNTRAKDDLDLYGECDQEYGILAADANETHSYSNRNEFESYSRLEGEKAFDFTCANDNNKFSSNQNIYAFEINNLKRVPNRTSNARLNFKCVNTNDFQDPNLNINKVYRETDNYKNINIDNSDNNNNFIVNSISNNLNTNENCELYNQSLCNQKDLDGNNKFAEGNKNYFKKIAQIQSEKSPSPKEFNNLNKQKPENEILLSNGIFKDSMRYQMQQLDKLFQVMNETSEAKVIIKAYKSKLKTKFYKIYESNSEFYKEKNKFRIFHKCNFPGCSRTFASAGWLKIHFSEHLKDIQNAKFNVEFEKSLLRLKHMNLLK